MKYGHRVPIPNFIFLCLPFGELLFTCVDLGQAALAGLPEAVAQIDAGIVHSPADHIVADVTGAGEVITQVTGVHCAHGGYCVALNAGDLNKTADGVAG